MDNKELINKLFGYIAIAAACGFYTDEELRNIIRLQQELYNGREGVDFA